MVDRNTKGVLTGSLVRSGVQAAAWFGIRHRRFFYAERDLRVPLPEHPANPALEVKVADDAVLDELRSMVNPLMWPTFDYDRQVSTCFVGSQDGSVKGFSWLRFRGDMHLDSDDRAVHPLAPGVCYTHHSVVFREFQCQGVFQTLLRYQYRYAAEQDYRYVTNLIERNNLPSLAAHTRLGHRLQSMWMFLLPGHRVINFGLRPSW